MHLSFPYGIDGGGRTATTEERRAHVRYLIETVLFTAPGERVNRPEFGAGVRELLFDTNSEAMATAAEFLIKSAIQRYLSELARVERLEVEREEGELRIILTWVLRGEEERFSDSFLGEV